MYLCACICMCVVVLADTNDEVFLSQLLAVTRQLILGPDYKENTGTCVVGLTRRYAAFRHSIPLLVSLALQNALVCGAAMSKSLFCQCT